MSFRKTMRFFLVALGVAATPLVLATTCTLDPSNIDLVFTGGSGCGYYGCDDEVIEIYYDDPYYYDDYYYDDTVIEVWDW
jgi:hypothetical protein